MAGRCRPPADAGFTLVEVVVAMVLLALLSLCTLPLFIRGLEFGVGYGDKTTATQWVSSLIEQARAQSPLTCRSLQRFAAANQATPFSDARGKPLRLTVVMPSCTAGSAVPVTVNAIDPAAASASAPVATATTMIYVR